MTTSTTTGYIETALARLSREKTYTAYLGVQSALERERATNQRREIRVSVLRNFTFEPLLPVLAGEIIRADFFPAIELGGFDTVVADAMNPQSSIYSLKPDLVVIALWLQTLAPKLLERFTALSPEEVKSEIGRVVDFIASVLHAIRKNSGVPILLNNFPLPARRGLGILDAQGDKSQTLAILELNAGIRDLARSIPDAYVVDYLTVLAREGAAALDEKSWQQSRLPFSRSAIISIGQEYGKFVRALNGRVKKCIALDCDNTLWGGILGEDGITGIQLGDTYPGSAFSAFQRELLSLHDRGILLAICSKNNEADVLEVLDTHPEMILRREHFVATKINWEDKATNLQELARDLNIGLDSIVFVDDSAFEADLVRQRLPEVTVLELQGEIANYAGQITESGLFDSLFTSKEDQTRSAHYKADTERRELHATAASLEEYLAGLEMVAEVGRTTEQTISRIAQLTQKTNQFNLTTRRYTEADIRSFVENPESEVIQLRLKDKVGDLGIVGAVIVNYSGASAEIDTFLFSCRALGRGAEIALAAEIIERAKSHGCQTIRGAFLPTAKNQQVADFYDRLGFKHDSTKDGGRNYSAKIENLMLPAQAITIIHI
jgi:FkbH-like protein